MKKTALLITALFGASLANAHNVWLEPVKDVKGQYVVKFGHEETETYPQSKLKAVRLLDAKGQLQNATVNFKEGEEILYKNVLKKELNHSKIDIDVFVTTNIIISN